MNKDLQERIEEAIELSKKPGIDLTLGSIGSGLSVSRHAATMQAKKPGRALTLVQLGNNQLRYVPQEGVRISKIGSICDDSTGYEIRWYSVECQDGTSFAISHEFQCGVDLGALTRDLSQVPEYLLLPKKEKTLVEAA